MSLIRNNIKGNLWILGLVFLASFALVSCGGKLDESDLRSSDDFDDADLTQPSNVSGSFMDFECDAISGNVACIVRHDGYSLPLGDSRILGSTKPTMVAYLVEDITAGSMSDFEKNTEIQAETVIDDSSDWGFSLNLSNSDYLLDLYNFVDSNQNNDNMGFVFSIDSSEYSPSGGSSERKYAVLDKCLFGYFLDEWINGDPDGNQQVTAIPSDAIAAFGGAALADKLYDQECIDKISATIKDKGEGRYMDDFNKGMTELFIDYLLLRGVGEEEFDAVAADQK
jgi:hypothetical protein